MKWKSTLELSLSSYIHSLTAWSALKVHSRILKKKIKLNKIPGELKWNVILGKAQAEGLSGKKSLIASLEFI